MYKTPMSVMLDRQAKTSPAITGTEEGAALNAYSFMLQAQDHLKNSDYAGYLCSMDLAGEFARKARDEFYARTHK